MYNNKKKTKKNRCIEKKFCVPLRRIVGRKIKLNIYEISLNFNFFYVQNWRKNENI